MIVDGHAHVWSMDTERYPWQPTFGIIPTEPASPDDLLRAMDRSAVDKAVLVQPSAYGPDHRHLFDTVAAHADRFVPIGLVDPADAESLSSAASLVADDGCVGLRVNLALDLAYADLQATDDAWATLAAVQTPICLRTTPAHHGLAITLLARHPGVTIVVDHLELPDLDDRAALDRIGELAAFPNCLLKVAGLARLSGAPPPFRRTWPLIEAAVRSFGSRRLLWGSDFPASGSEDDYVAGAQSLAAVPSISESDREQIMSLTARQLWLDMRPARA